MLRHSPCAVPVAMPLAEPGGKKGLKRCTRGDNKDFLTDTPAGSQLGGSFPHRYASVATLNVLKGPN